MGIELVLAVLMLAAAALYTSVGHAGASAYLALMALFGVASPIMRPTALALNILIACFTSYRYTSAGLFSWRTLWPFLLGAAPAAFLGGMLELPDDSYRLIVGLVLIAAAIRLWFPDSSSGHEASQGPSPAVGIASGAGIGLLSGLTGTGGGIFLSPLVLLLGWCDARITSGVVAVFILCNSAAALSGSIASVQNLPPELPLYAGAVLAGACISTFLGIKRFARGAILKALAIVLVIAGIKLALFS